MYRPEHQLQSLWNGRLRKQKAVTVSPLSDKSPHDSDSDVSFSTPMIQPIAFNLSKKIRASFGGRQTFYNHLSGITEDCLLPVETINGS